MKTILRAAASLAFISFFTAGALLLREAAAGRTRSEQLLPTVLGLFLVGVASFAGPILMVAAERCGVKDGARK